MANRENIPRSVVETVVKMLSCKTKFAGHDEYSCSNPDCKHTKTVTYTCKSRLCSSCGKKPQSNGLLHKMSYYQSANINTSH
ncbi:transposase zinc-binding domain-containing protein [Piscirickettsia salmonis]|uniref:transposase zinc-binding domain-containing protein n=1 Tax=Piscirickettsia salmonis TaxID=1238 RepID=UPI0018AC9FB2